MDIINELVRQDSDESTERLAKHLKTIEKDMSNRGETQQEQVKNIQQTLHAHLKDQDRAKPYLTHIDE
jgi:chaperonin cofactor prefoldin